MVAVFNDLGKLAVLYSRETTDNYVKNPLVLIGNHDIGFWYEAGDRRQFDLFLHITTDYGKPSDVIHLAIDLDAPSPIDDLLRNK